MSRWPMALLHPQRSSVAPRHARPRGFTLIEGMVSASIMTVVLLGAIGSYTGSQAQAKRSRDEFTAFTIAQQSIEMLSSVPSTSPLLDSIATGDVDDPSPTAGVDGPIASLRRVNEVGEPDSNGHFQIYWKIENISTSVRQVKVYCAFGTGGDQFVSIQTFR